MYPIAQNLDVHLKDARSKLFHTYMAIAKIAIIIYSTVFAYLGLYRAATIQALFLILFIMADHVYRRGYKVVGIIIGLLLSDVIVLMQVFLIFTRDAGFHFQFFALMIINFLVLDLYHKRERIIAVLLAAVSGIVMLLCHAYAITPMLPTDLPIDHGLMHNLSMVITLSAIILLLYTYSVQLAMKERALSFMASNDLLTGAHNRAHFSKRGAELFGTYKTLNLPFSVIILDLDDFKKINDTMGHPAGDYVLTSVSALIANQLQDKDIFARYGGEEFGILMPEAKREDAWKIAETLRQSLDSLTLNFAGREIHVTMSIGIATMDKNHDSFDSLVVAADRQLYISKGKGKNCTSM